MSSLEESRSNNATPNLIHIHSVHEEIKPFKCNFCDFETAKKQNIKNHIECIHEGKKPFKCNICDFETAQKRNLKNHITRVHEGKKPFK